MSLLFARHLLNVSRLIPQWFSSRNGHWILLPAIIPNAALMQMNPIQRQTSLLKTNQVEHLNCLRLVVMSKKLYVGEDVGIDGPRRAQTAAHALINESGLVIPYRFSLRKRCDSVVFIVG
jgi:hypothetical protein